MANNAASIAVTPTLLPDTISKQLDDITVSYQPANATEGWYYQLTDITTSSTDLIAATSFLQTGPAAASNGVNTGSSIASIAPGSDKVKFLFIKHRSVEGDGTSNTADSIYLCLDGGAAAYTSGDCIEIGPGECWFAKLNTAIENIHVISDQKDRGSGSPQGEIQAEVYAIIDDL